MKDVILGMGEVGLTLYQLLKDVIPIEGADIDPERCIKTTDYHNCYFLHVCIPYDNNFFHSFDDAAGKYKPKAIIIHSTVPPGTAKTIQAVYNIPIISAPTRGTHKRFLEDMKRYTKLFGMRYTPEEIDIKNEFIHRFNNARVKVRELSDTTTCELAKILTDITYYGWLITYAQITKLICDKYSVDYDEMWEFAEEIQENLGNRPKMYPGFIGGHCVIPNLELIKDSAVFEEVRWLINEFNSEFKKEN